MLSTQNHQAGDPDSRRQSSSPDDLATFPTLMYQAAVAELGKIAFESTSLFALYRIVASRLCQLFDVDRIAIMEVEDERRLVLKGGLGWSPEKIGSIVAEWNDNAPYAVPTILRGPFVTESFAMLPSTYGVVPPGTTGVASVQTVPVGKNESPVGAIGLYSGKRRSFTSDELMLLKSIAQILASAIERSRTDERIRRHITETTILSEIARIIGSSLKIDEVYPLFVEQVARLLPFDRITVSTINHIDNTQQSTYASGINVPEWMTGPPTKIDGSAVEAAVQAQTGMAIQDENLEDLRRNYPQLDLGSVVGLRSMLTVPVIWNGEVTNMLTLRSKQVNPYRDQDIHVAERIAAQIAGALANSKRHDEEMAFAAEQATLAEVSRIIASSVRIEEIYPRFAESVRKLIPFDRITVTTINEESTHVMSRYAWGRDFPGSTIVVYRPLQGTLTAAVAKARAGMVISAENILNGSDNFSYLEAGLKAGLQSAMGIPLIFRGRVIGAMLLRSLRSDAYSQRELAQAERVATQISGIVWNAQLQEQMEKTAQRQVLLADLSTEMIKAKDLPTVYERLHEKISQCIQFDHFAIAMFDLDHSCLEYEFVRGTEVNGFTQDSVVYRPVGPSTGLWSDLLSQHYDANQQAGGRPGGHETAFAQAGLVSWVQIPLGFNGRTIGQLSLGSKKLNAYSHSDLLTLERIAEQVTLAIENVNYYRRLQQIATKCSMFEAMISASGRYNEPHQLLREFVKQMRGSIPADHMDMSYIDDAYKDLASVVNAANESDKQSTFERIELNRLATAVIVNSRESLVLTDAESSELTGADQLQAARAMFASGHRSSLSVPLVRGVVVGALHFHSTSPETYSDHIMNMAEQAGTLLIGAVGPSRGFRQTSAPSGSEQLSGADPDLVQRGQLARHRLSDNDVAILRAVAAGLTNFEIAEQLNFATGTIKNRLAKIYKIFEVSDRAAAMAFAIRCGIID